MLGLMTKLATLAAIGGLLVLLGAMGSCASKDKTQISQADEGLTYGDTIGQDADEMMDLIENA
jgi:hypothetical protein